MDKPQKKINSFTFFLHSFADWRPFSKWQLISLAIIVIVSGLIGSVHASTIKGFSARVVLQLGFFEGPDNAVLFSANSKAVAREIKSSLAEKGVYEVSANPREYFVVVYTRHEDQAYLKKTMESVTGDALADMSRQQRALEKRIGRAPLTSPSLEGGIKIYQACPSICRVVYPLSWGGASGGVFLALMALFRIFRAPVYLPLPKQGK